MAKILGINVADELSDIIPVAGELTLEDFHNDTQMFEMYRSMMSLAESWDNSLQVAESTKKFKD